MEELEEMFRETGEQSALMSDDEPAGGENSLISSLDIISLFGKENLEYIQESLSKTTGLAFVTVNYRGEPVTDTTFFTRFCRRFRGDDELRQNCRTSDAVSSIQAAVTRKTHIYICPCGLVELAIPIIVEGNYLGGFLGGQVRCEDLPESVKQVAPAVNTERFKRLREEMQGAYEELPVYSYEKILDIAKLVSLVITQLSENRVNQYFQEDMLKKRIKKIRETSQRHLKEKEKMEIRLQEAEARLDPYSFLDMLIALQNVSTVENAIRTADLADMFIHSIRYRIADKETFVHFSGELEYAEQYLKFQKIRMGGRFSYSIHFPKEMHMMKLPSGILFPFVQNAFYNGVMLKPEGGSIEIKGRLEYGKIMLDIIDTGCGFSEDDINIRFEPYRDKHEGHYIRLGMECAKRKLKQLFGEECSISMDVTRKAGCRCGLVFPEYR